MKLVIFLILCSKNVLAQQGVSYLTKNFIANLQANLQDLNDSSYEFIDKQVENYIKIIKSQNHHVPPEGHARYKRDTFQGNFDIQHVSGLIPMETIKTDFGKDLMLFQQRKNGNLTWYAVVLEGGKEGSLNIFKNNGTIFQKLVEQPVKNGVRLGLYTVPKGTYIVVAENTTSASHFNNKTAVFFFSEIEELKKIQNLDVDYASDVAIWGDKGDIFMAISKQMTNLTGKINYSTKSLVYKWLGEHFDVIQQINTTASSRVTPFTIGKSHFLAFSNQFNDYGESNVYSEIYKYDLESDKFVSYQKLLTDGANDIKFFCFKSESRKENFLVVANTFSTDINGIRKYTSPSIIYKFVDNFFIPFQNMGLHGVTDWLPVIGINGEFALLAACKFNGLKIFQYNGWNFVETKVQYTDDSFASGIISMNSYIFNNKSVIVVANENNHGDMVNLYEMTFVEGNDLNIFFTNMLKWCKKCLIDEQNINATISNKAKRSTFDPKYFDNAHNDILTKTEKQQPSKVLNTTSEIAETSTQTVTEVITEATTEILTTTESIANSNFGSSNTTQMPTAQNQSEIVGQIPIPSSIQELLSQIDSQKLQLQNLQIKLQETTLQSEINIQENISAQSILLTSSSFLEGLTTNSINNINIIDFIKTTINLINPNTFQNLQIKSATINPPFKPEIINGRKIEDLLNKNQILNLENLVINGNIIFESGLETKLINNLNITSDSVLKKFGDQVLNGKIGFENLNVEKLSTNFLNRLLLSSLEINNEKIPISFAENLNVENLVVGGTLNKIDLPTLDKYALRTFGDQEISSNFNFEDLHLATLNTDSLNGHVIPDDLIRIDEGEYRIEQDVQFIKDLVADKIEVVDRLNQIVVKYGKLDVLLHNAEGEQRIDGVKIFENVELLKPISLQSKIIYKGKEKINPVSRFETDFEKFEDVVIRGNITIENIVTTTDLQSGNSGYSISNLLKKGLRLTDRDVTTRLDFEQQLNVVDIFVEKINNISPLQWVVNGQNDSQYIKGWKLFEGDIFITGPTNLVNVNNIHLPDTESNILKTFGNQVITGKHSIKKVDLDSLKTSKVTFGQNPLETIVMYNAEQIITGKTTIKSIKANQIETNNLETSGFINNYNFAEMVSDTVFKNATQKIPGFKYFENLKVDKLISRKNINMNKLPHLIRKGEAIIPVRNHLILPDNLVIEKMEFESQMNGINALDLSSNWLQSGGQQTISGDQYIDRLELNGKAFISTNRINGVDLTELKETSIKADEDITFEAITFKKDLISRDTIAVLGHIEGLDLENIVAFSDKEVIIKDEITFNENVEINGTLFIDGLINGNFNLTNLCQFANPHDNDESKMLLIDGNAIFVKGPKVITVNGHILDDLLNNAWLTDKESFLKGHVNFGNAIFEDTLEVNGFLDEIKLDILSNNYLSKSKDQIVNVKLNFLDGFSVTNDLQAPSATVKNELCGINLTKFLSSVILQGPEQIFENTVFAENLKIDEINGEFLVNNLNLRTDVMRYDEANVVTGKKVVTNLNVGLLKIKNNINVQDVDILDWIFNGILTLGSYRMTGLKIFTNYTNFQKPIDLKGTLNQKPFTKDYIMLKSIPQAFSQKVFIGNKQHFSKIILNGFLNEQPFKNLIENQVYKNQDSIILSPIKFEADLKTENINFESLYEDTNVTQLLNNLTNYASLNNYYGNYDNLLDISINIKESLNAQAYFLHHFQAREIYEAENMFPIQNYHNDFYLVKTEMINGTTILDFLKWSPTDYAFRIDPELYGIKFPYSANYISGLDFEDTSYLYTEHFDTYGKIEANIFSKLHTKSFERLGVLETNGTRTITAFTLPEIKTKCFLNLQHNDDFIYILCFETEITTHQKISINKALDAKVVTIEDTLYIIGISNERDASSVIIWKYDVHTTLFNEVQRIFIVSPNSSTLMKHNGITYLAISSGYLLDTAYPGQIDIRRFEKKTQQFTQWQRFSVEAPIQIEFAVLPTNEFLLYILCDNPTEALIVYQYEGISKFSRNTVISSLSRTYSMTLFTYKTEHFILTRNDGVYTLIQAVFKGNH